MSTKDKPIIMLSAYRPPLSIELEKDINDLQSHMQKVVQQLAELEEARATMIVNFGIDGRTIKGIISGDESLTEMIRKLFDYMKRSPGDS